MSTADRRLPASPPVPPESLAIFDAEVARHYPWNLRANLVYGLFGTTGLRLISAPTFVPEYLYRLGGSNLLVGLALVVGGLCRFAGPLFATALVAHRLRVKPWSVAIGAMMRVAILGIVLAAFWLPGEWNLLATITCLGLFHFFDGMQSVAYSVVMGKIIPLARRGRFIGTRDFLGGSTVAALSLPLGRVLEDVPFPRNYGFMYLAALLLTAMGLACFAVTREPSAPWKTASRSVLETLQHIPKALRRDTSFANYCLARALGTAAMTATPFFILYARASVSLSGLLLGRLSFLFFVAQTLANPLWGRVADRRGFRSVALMAGILWMTAALVLLIVPHTLPALGLVFTLVGAGQGGFRMASANMVFEFGLDSEFAQRVATVNVIGELVGAVAPLGAGILADRHGHAAVLLLSLLIMCVAQAAMALGVRGRPRVAEG